MQLYGDERKNSPGIDMSNEHRLASLSSALLTSAMEKFTVILSLVVSIIVQKK